MAERFGVEETRVPKHRRQTGRKAEQAPQCRLTPTRARVNATGRTQGPPTAQSGLGAGPTKLEQAFQSSIVNGRIRIEQHDVLTRARFHAQVASPGEADIVIEGQQADALKLRRDHGRRAVRAGVVDDNDLEVDLSSLGYNGRQTTSEQVSRVVGDDDEIRSTSPTLSAG